MSRLGLLVEVETYKSTRTCVLRAAKLTSPLPSLSPFALLRATFPYWFDALY